ncbi:hypothetical protein SRHO_G00073780 [Serrasalmus rhombeus]
MSGQRISLKRAQGLEAERTERPWRERARSSMLGLIRRFASHSACLKHTPEGLHACRFAHIQIHSNVHWHEMAFREDDRALAGVIKTRQTAKPRKLAAPPPRLQMPVNSSPCPVPANPCRDSAAAIRPHLLRFHLFQ